MKLFRYIGIAIMLLLVSCAKTEIDSGQEQEIDLKVINSALTKAGSTLDKDIALGVFATFNNQTANSFYLANNKFMCRDNSTSWGNVNPGDNTPLPVYWPNNNDMYFTIYAPYQTINAGTGIHQDINKGEFSILQDIKASDNFMYGEKFYLFNKNSGNYAVNLKHAGVLLCFKAKCSSENILINSITIKAGNYNETGKVNIKYKSTPQSSTVIWSDKQLSQSDLVLSNSNHSTPITGVGQDIVEIVNGKTKEGLYVIPGNQTSFIVNYQIVGTDKKLDATINLGSSTTWEAGKKYIYTLVFAANEIKFTASSEDWSGPTESTINPN